MDIKHVGNASLLASTPRQPRVPAPATPPQSAGDVVNLSAKNSSPMGASASEGDLAAYNGVLDTTHGNPTAVMEAHSGLDPDRVNRLLGLLD